MSVFVEFSTDPIRLTEQGVWMHGDDKIIPRVAELFAKNLAVTAAGAYVITIDRYNAPVQVADTAFFVRSMNIVGDIERVELAISDGSERLLTRLMQSADNVLYCTVPCREWDGEKLTGRTLDVPCRFPSSLYHALALHAEIRDERGVLKIGAHHVVFDDYISGASTSGVGSE